MKDSKQRELAGECCLYRYFDSNNRLLYVGISKTPLKRMEVHGYRSDWSSKSASLTIQRFDNRVEALKAEAMAIRKEHPLYNVSGKELSATAAKEKHSTVPSLAFLRRKAGFSQYALAKQVGVTEMSISNYESGRNAPSARILIAIAKALNVTVDDLLHDISGP